MTRKDRRVLKRGRRKGVKVQTYSVVLPISLMNEIQRRANHELRTTSYQVQWFLEKGMGKKR